MQILLVFKSIDIRQTWQFQSIIKKNKADPPRENHLVGNMFCPIRNLISGIVFP